MDGQISKRETFGMTEKSFKENVFGQRLLLETTQYSNRIYCQFLVVKIVTLFFKLLRTKCYPNRFDILYN